jgi:hypothetical protein
MSQGWDLSPFVVVVVVVAAAALSYYDSISQPWHRHPNNNLSRDEDEQTQPEPICAAMLSSVTDAPAANVTLPHCRHYHD